MPGEDRAVLSQDGGLTDHLKDQLGGGAFSLKGITLACKCRQRSKLAETVQFLKTLFTALLITTQYFCENP